MNTLLLDRSTWDLCLDASGNVAMASDPYSIVQDVASAIRLFTNELWYGGADGVPYFESILGQWSAGQIMKAQFVKAAETVPGVLSAAAFLTLQRDRQVAGQVQITARGLNAATGQVSTFTAGISWVNTGGYVLTWLNGGGSLINWVKG